MALRQTLMQVPATEFTVIGVQSPSITWIGTRQGAMRLTRDTRCASISPDCGGCQTIT